MGTSLLESVGSRNDKETRFAPIWVDRFFAGLFTNRNFLRSPFGALIAAFYHVAGLDALVGGLNVEVSNQLTLIRRPGNTAGYSNLIPSANLPDTPDSFYSFHEITGTIRIIVDGAINGPYLAIGGPSSGANVWVPLFTKAVNAGQTFYQGVGQALYMSDLGDQQKWLDFGAGVPGNSFSLITASSLTGNVVTISAVNNFAPGQIVVVSHTTNGSGAFNGTFIILSANATQFTYALTHANVSSASESGYASATWNTGIVAPTVPPAVTSVASGAAAVSWVASTMFTTMGLLVDANGNIQQLISVNASGTNTTQLGKTGNGQPAWSTPATPGSTTTDNTVTWYSFGQITQWKANHAYAGRATIYDPVSGGLYTANSAGGTSGSSKPHFVNISVDSSGNLTTFGDGTITWECNGSPLLWKPSHTYTAWWEHPADYCVEPVLPTAINTADNTTQPVYFQIANPCGSYPAFVGACSNTGVSGTGYTPQWGTIAGALTTDGDLIWRCLGSDTWAASTSYTAWTPSGGVFSALKDSNGNFQVCIVSHVSGLSQPTWGTNYGSISSDGNWVCVGTAANSTWVASTQWYLPSVGFVPPSSADPFGGAEVDGSSFVQAVVASGLSNTSAPSWSVTIGGSTTDNTVTWRTVSAFSQNSITFTSGFGYCYAFKARTVTDPFSTITAGGNGISFGLPPLSPNGTSTFGVAPPAAPTGSADGSVSTASPTFQLSGSNSTGAVLTVTGLGSTDPQVDTISIFRTTDGGGTYFWLTDIPNPAPVGGVASPWTFTDFLPSYPTALFNGLDTNVVAPLAHFNDPPPTGLVNLVQHFGRLWGSVGAFVYASDGPLVGGAAQPPGNGFTAWNPAQVFRFPSPVTKLVPTNTGLLVFTTSDLFYISGGPAISAMFPQILLPGYGLSSFNALCLSGGVIYFISSDRRGIALDANMGVNELGLGIGDLLAGLNPSAVYCAFHSQGSNDHAWFVADGSTGWFRCNPTQAPDSQITGGIVWSPKANITGGAQAIGSVEAAAGNYVLLIGATSANQPILVRDSNFSVFTDNGSAYAANVIMGNIVLAQPGQIAELGFITCDFVRTGTSPKILVLLDEIGALNANISAASQSGGNTTYTYTLNAGSASPTNGMLVTISGMAHSGNNGSFFVTNTGVGTFTVVNANGVTATETGSATSFEDLSGYVSSTTGLPPQDPALIFGLTETPASLFSNRYFFEQSINGSVPRATSCRSMQIKIDFGTDTVKNEILSLCIFGAIDQEQ